MRLPAWCNRWLKVAGPSRETRLDRDPPPPTPDGLSANYDQTLRALEADYPVIDPAAGSYREEVMLQFYARVAGFIKDGVAPVPALHRAELEVLQPLKLLQERVAGGGS